MQISQRHKEKTRRIYQQQGPSGGAMDQTDRMVVQMGRLSLHCGTRVMRRV